MQQHGMAAGCFPHCHPTDLARTAAYEPGIRMSTLGRRVPEERPWRVWRGTSQERSSGMDVDRGRIEHLEHRVETLEEAVEHRIVIGEALGIIMERLGVDDAKAFDYLS